MSRNSYTAGCGACDNILCNTHGCQKYRFPSLAAHQPLMIPYVAVPEVTFHNMKADITTLRAEVERLTIENASLASWQCEFTDGKTGLVYSEHGGTYCAMAKREATLRAEIEQLREALRKADKGLAAGVSQYATRTFHGQIVPGDEQAPWIRLMQIGWDATQAALAQEKP